MCNRKHLIQVFKCKSTKIYEIAIPIKCEVINIVNHAVSTMWSESRKFLIDFFSKMLRLTSKLGYARMPEQLSEWIGRRESWMFCLSLTSSTYQKEDTFEPLTNEIFFSLKYLFCSFTFEHFEIVFCSLSFNLV